MQVIFSRNEAFLICNACQEQEWQPEQQREQLLEHIGEAFQDYEDLRWEVDGTELLQKIEAFTETAASRIIRRTGTFWKDLQNGAKANDAIWWSGLIENLCNQCGEPITTIHGQLICNCR